MLKAVLLELTKVLGLLANHAIKIAKVALDLTNITVLLAPIKGKKSNQVLLKIQSIALILARLELIKTLKKLAYLAIKIA